MSRRDFVREGKAKILYQGPSANTFIQYFKDEATAFNATKCAVIKNKGILNNCISEYIMKNLNLAGIPTHLIKKINTREQLIHAVEILPIEIVVRNFSAGSFAKRFDIPEGEPLSRPVVEYFYKNDKLGDPMVSEDHIVAFGWANQQELEDALYLAMRVNDFLRGLFLGLSIQLIDLKIEVGRIWEVDTYKIIVADEISPDCSRLWDIQTGKKLDKDIFREDLGDLMEGYTEIARRMGILYDDTDAENSALRSGPRLVC
jgi:phosphoribosylaminoimidazole-succinocarboxamide synthase